MNTLLPMRLLKLHVPRGMRGRRRLSTLRQISPNRVTRSRVQRTVYIGRASSLQRHDPSAGRGLNLMLPEACVRNPEEQRRHDYLGPIGAATQAIELPEGVFGIRYRDCGKELADHFRDVFRKAWNQMAEADRRIIADRLLWGQRTALLLGVLPGLWLLPTVNRPAGYVTAKGGVIVFDSLAFEGDSDSGNARLIRHELAHVWQAHTGMWNCSLNDEQLEVHADWMAAYWLQQHREWKPIGVDTPDASANASAGSRAECPVPGGDAGPS